MLLSYGKTLNGEKVTPDAATSFFTTFIDAGRANLSAITELEEAIVAVDRKIARHNEKTAEHRGEAHGEVVITLSAREAGKVKFNLTYREYHPGCSFQS
jgi:hypothetical protein